MSNAALDDLAAIIWNTILCAHSLLEHTNVTVWMNKAALDDSRSRNLDIECATHINLNRLLVCIVFFLTERLDPDLAWFIMPDFLIVAVDWALLFFCMQQSSRPEMAITIVGGVSRTVRVLPDF